jgi:hypothetical protein
MQRRPLTLPVVPDELLTDCGLRRGGAAAPSYRCGRAGAVLVAVTDIVAPVGRMLNREALADILRGFRDGDEIPPIEVYADAGTHHVLDGLHRLKASGAYGFTMIPCEPKTRAFAEEFRGFPWR